MREISLKDAKKGDKILVLVPDGKKAYQAWAVIVGLEPPRQIYDPGMTKNIWLTKLTYKVDSGSHKGQTRAMWLEEGQLLNIPPHPGKLRRIWNAFWS